MKNNLKDFYLDIIGGICVSIGATIFLNTQNPFLFAIGIWLVVTLGANLITGYIPKSVKNNEFNLITALRIAIGNFIGCLLFYCTLVIAGKNEIVKTMTADIVNSKTNITWYGLIVSGIIVGILVGISIEAINNKDNYFEYICKLFIPIMIFVVLKMDHVVANVFYLAASEEATFYKLLYYVGIVGIGNLIGGFIIGKKLKNII